MGGYGDRLGLEAVSRVSSVFSLRWFIVSDGLGWMIAIERYLDSHANHWLVLASSILQDLDTLPR